MASETGIVKEQNKHYKRRHAKVKRSKSQGYRQDRTGTVDGELLGNESPSTDEDLIKLKETLKQKKRSNRKLMLMDWDKTPFVFSVKSKNLSAGLNLDSRISRCKSISTIEEEEEREEASTVSEVMGIANTLGEEHSKIKLPSLQGYRGDVNTRHRAEAFQMRSTARTDGFQVEVNGHVFKVRASHTVFSGYWSWSVA